MPKDDNRTIRHFLNSLSSSIKPKIRAEQLQSMRTAMVGADFDTLEEAYTAARNHERKLIATAKAIGYETYMGPAGGSLSLTVQELKRQLEFGEPGGCCGTEILKSSPLGSGRPLR